MILIFLVIIQKSDKNSIEIVEILRIDPVVLQANQEKFQKVSIKFKNGSELDKFIKQLKK